MHVNRAKHNERCVDTCRLIQQSLQLRQVFGVHTLDVNVARQTLKVQWLDDVNMHGAIFLVNGRMNGDGSAKFGTKT